MGPSRLLLKRILFLIAVMLFINMILDVSYVFTWGPINNSRNYSVRTTVNVTEAYPEILNISCNQNSAITLNAGTTKSVGCLVVIRDYNGGDTLNGTNGSNVNATFYYFLNSSSDPNSGAVHYTNATCGLNGTPNGYYVNWSCTFDVWYYAFNGTWRINATILDTHNYQNLTTSAIFNSSISALLALNVTDVINYGSMYVGETTLSLIPANVTNFGNMPINVTVYGYGGDNATTGAGLAMICQQRNLSLSNERYSLNNTDVYGSMNVLTGIPQMIANLSLNNQIYDGVDVKNSTYWALHVNVTDNPYGQCNGSVVFSAITA